MRRSPKGIIRILQALIVSLTTLGVGVDVWPVSLLTTFNASESDLPFAPDSEDGQDEVPDGLGDLALPHARAIAYRGSHRAIPGSLTPGAMAGSTGARNVAGRAIGSASGKAPDLPTRLCRLTC